MKRCLKVAVLLMAVLIGVASCGKDEPDGKWAKMKWEDKSGLAKVNGVYIVPASGGTYTFTCQNYKPWIDYCNYGFYEMAVSSSTHVIGEWFEVECVDHDVIVTFQPLDDLSKSRSLTVVMTAGDIFDQLVFEQRP